MNKQNDYFMKEALKEAFSSGSDLPIGAVLVYDNEIVARASNTKEKSGNPLNHAEKIVIEEGIKKIGNFRDKKVQLYVTLEPCPMCATAIILSRIDKVCFGAYDLLYGALGSKMDMRKIMNSKLKVTSGILEEECSNILKNYFKKMRGDSNV